MKIEFFRACAIGSALFASYHLFSNAALAQNLEKSKDTKCLQAQIDKLSADFDKDLASWDKRSKESKTKSQKEAHEKTEPRAAYAKQFLQIMRTDPSNPATIWACSWLLIRSFNTEITDEVKACIRKHHTRNPNVDYVIPLLPTPTLREIALNNPREDVRMRAKLSLAAAISKEAPIEARYLLEELIKTGKQIKEWKGSYKDTDPTIAQRAKKVLFEMDQLAVGKPAPDIVGEDVYGNTFKLSDYRGKVIVLDFFGEW